MLFFDSPPLYMTNSVKLEHIDSYPTVFEVFLNAPKICHFSRYFAVFVLKSLIAIAGILIIRNTWVTAPISFPF